MQQEIVSGSGISWAIRKSARDPVITTTASHHQWTITLERQNSRGKLKT